MFEALRLMHPEWLLALIPLGLLVWVLGRSATTSAWRRVVDPQLLPMLLTTDDRLDGRFARWLLATAWIIAVIALAGPAWDRKPQPLFQSTAARVIVLDLSQSMNSRDLTPSRLVRARFKVADMLGSNWDGQTGVVVFAGDAFVVAPLTTDTDTITNMLEVLEPSLMPVQGSRVDLGLSRARELLEQTGVAQGEIILVSDGFTGERAISIAAELRATGHRLQVLGVGTLEGAPVPNGQGALLRDANGKVVIPGLTRQALQRLAVAGGGRYASISPDGADLERLLDGQDQVVGKQAEETAQTSEVWNEQGPKLVLLLLPLAGLAFRRGWLLCLALLIGGVLPSGPTMAFGWQDLWQRPDQQAADALQRGDLERSLELAEDPARRGVAEYRRGEYSAALQAFEQAQGADAAYNRGNALARLGRYQEAVSAYGEALRARPEMEDAAYNKRLLEQLLRQQESAQAQQGAGQPEGRGTEAEQQSGEGQTDSQEGQGENRDAGAAASSSQDDSSEGQTHQNEGAADQQDRGQNPQTQGVGQAEQGTGKGKDKPTKTGARNRDDSEQGSHNAFAQAVADQEAAAEAGDETENGDGPHSHEQDSARFGEQVEAQTATAAVPADRTTDMSADPLNSEERLAAERWLRRIQDDPGGLLRRKFLYQYSRRPAAPGTGEDQPW